MVNYTDMIEINSISNFDLNFDSCMATINAALKGNREKVFGVLFIRFLT